MITRLRKTPSPRNLRRATALRRFAGALWLLGHLVAVPETSWAQSTPASGLPPTLEARGRTTEPRLEPVVRVSLGSGHDGNVAFAPRGAVDGPLGLGAETGAWFASAGLTLGVGRDFAPLRVDVTYDLYQTAYEARARSSSFHLQALELRASDLGRRLFGWELALRGDLSFLGAGNMRPFQRSGAIEPELVVGRRRAVRLRVGAQVLAIDTLDPGLAYLSGRRFEARATPELVLAGWRVSAPLRWRADRTGSFHGDPLAMDDADCAGCTIETVSPTSNQAFIAAIRLMTPFGWTVRPGLAARIEHRVYAEPDHDLVRAPDDTRRTGSRFRTDRRLWAEASLRVQLGEHWSVVGRYQVGENTSWLVGGGAGLEARTVRRPVAMVELEADWM